MNGINHKSALIIFLCLGLTLTLLLPDSALSMDRPNAAPPNMNPFNSGPPMSVQGCLSKCVYCTQVRPNMVKKDCPLCHGKIHQFQPARMMDRWSSWVEVVGELQDSVKKEQDFLMLEKPKNEDAQRLRQELIKLLRHIDIYGFDPKKRIAERIRELEDNHGLGPK